MGVKQRSTTIGQAIIILWMFGPLIPAIIAGIVASACGCKLDEGNTHPCLLFGVDIGKLLYTMGVMGLFTMGTFPSGILALILFSLFVRWRDRK